MDIPKTLPLVTDLFPFKTSFFITLKMSGLHVLTETKGGGVSQSRLEKGNKDNSATVSG